ncbi:hypothetical protein AMS68_001395 [Peltaster fructicola]|uniref:MADS-box domain-containing protein n=1 Tax=Peltaster fructicola TaxID=286661 RepID=A0A6H0XMM9_9PEZI|nr:hypothetical protein AMS68_001395 [Peltaster fructicola]
MGRRKIEIKPIRDDRNRSVTFLKRKGGLFKKAHELSVLCSVDVAVIIFGHNKKLYEYSSGDINETIGRFQYYGGAHEHKGPADFADKNGGDDEDEDEDGGEDGGEERGTPEQRAMMQPGMQHHPGFQHVRHGTPSYSPPMPNGAMPQFQRVPSPLPPNAISRPSSRMSQHGGAAQHIRRPSSNLAPQAQMQAPPPGTYAYQPNQPFYPPPGAPIQRPQQATYPPPGYPAQNPQIAQAVMQDQRRASMPTAFPNQPTPPQGLPRNPSQEHLQPPQQHHPRMSPQPQHRAPPSPQPPREEFTSPPIPQPRPLPAHARAQSIFTPIDDSRSLLAQHWGTSVSAELKPEPRSISVDVASMQRDKAKEEMTANGTSPKPQTRAAGKASQRTGGTPTGVPPTRTNTNSSDAKRPRLKVQIPSEHSEDEAGTANSEAQLASDTSNPSNANGTAQATGPSHGVVLPPPSPSANALLSAGAQGPPNPFARPAPPMSTNPHAANRDANHIETPMSALPSRFMSDNLLPSPSTFYPEWGFGRDSNMLPSPLNFQTPVVPSGSGWKEDDRKRAAEEEAAQAAKRQKS